MANRIPENTSVEAKFAKFIYAKDIMITFTVIVFAYFATLIGLVPESSETLFYLICVFVLAILIIRPFATNPKRRQLQVFILTFKKDRKTYEEIPVELIEKYREGKENGDVQYKKHYKQYINSN